MTGKQLESSTPQPIGDRTIIHFQELVADPDFFCGGGCVAAVTGATSASLVLLVLGLNRKRRVNAEIRSEIDAAISATEVIQARLNASADDDISDLHELLEAQREAKTSGDRAPYRKTLEQAAATPLLIARDCLELLALIDAHLGNASRFTVSDLGAAAALAFGSLQSASLMSEVNLALLNDEAEVDARSVNRMSAEASSLVQDGARLAQRIDASTRSAMRREQRTEG